jgi:hypothetical protein
MIEAMEDVQAIDRTAAELREMFAAFPILGWSAA